MTLSCRWQCYSSTALDSTQILFTVKYSLCLTFFLLHRKIFALRTPGLSILIQKHSNNTITVDVSSLKAINNPFFFQRDEGLTTLLPSLLLQAHRFCASWLHHQAMQFLLHSKCSISFYMSIRTKTDKKILQWHEGSQKRCSCRKFRCGKLNIQVFEFFKHKQSYFGCCVQE